MEVLKDQINIFGVLDKEVKVEKKAVIKSVSKAHKNRSERNSETEVLEGQITAFELVEVEEKEAISNFTDGQLKTIEQLKSEKDWIENIKRVNLRLRKKWDEKGTFKSGLHDILISCKN